MAACPNAAIAEMSSSPRSLSLASGAVSSDTRVSFGLHNLSGARQMGGGTRLPVLQKRHLEKSTENAVTGD